MELLRPQWHHLPVDESVHGEPLTLAEHGIKNITVLGRLDGLKGDKVEGLLHAIKKPAAEQGFSVQVIATEADPRQTIEKVRAANRGREVLMAVGGDGIFLTAMQAARDSNMVVYGVAGGKTNDGVRGSISSDMLLHPESVFYRPVLLRSVSPLQATVRSKQRSSDPADNGALQEVTYTTEADQYLGIGFSGEISRIMNSEERRSHRLEKVLGSYVFDRYGHYFLDRYLTAKNMLPGKLKNFSVGIDGLPTHSAIDEQFVKYGSVGGSMRPDISPDAPYARYMESTNTLDALVTTANLGLGRSIGRLISAVTLEIDADHIVYGNAGGEVFAIDASQGPVHIEVQNSERTTTIVTKPGPLTQAKAKQYRP